MLVRFNVEKLNNENQYCIPLSINSQQKRSVTPPGKPSYWWFFSYADLDNARAIAKKTSLIGRRLARTWHNPSNKLKGAGTLLAETQQNLAPPGGTDLANLAEPGGAAEPSGTRRNPRGTRQRNPAEEPGGNLAEPGEKKVSWTGGGWEYKPCQKVDSQPPPLQLTFPPGSARFPPGFRQVSAPFHRVLQGFAGFW